MEEERRERRSTAKKNALNSAMKSDRGEGLSAMKGISPKNTTSMFGRVK